MNDTRRFLLGLGCICFALFAVYVFTLQTIPNGADHYYMADVGETQIVLNLWGTLHATGYPLYVITGNLLVALLRALGVDPAAAPAVVSLIWTLAALGVMCLLAHRLAGLRAALLVTALFGLTRTVWIHAAIAEIYSFGLLILALLLLLALWPAALRGRLYGLALLGGIGVFHHRALLMAAPALVYAAWPEIQRTVRRPGGGRHLIALLLVGLLGFLPYFYLPLRASAGAAWVYGTPDTWQGFRDQFMGREAAQFIGLPDSLDALLANFHMVNLVLVTDLTLPGLIAGLAGLVLALRTARFRRAAMTFLLNGLAAYLFHILLYVDILSALILPVTLSMAFGWLFLVVWLRENGFSMRIPFAVTVLFAAVLIAQNLPFIRRLTTDPTGLQTIALAQGAPPGSALMLNWGVHHFAVGFGRDILGLLPDITLIDHNADFRAVIAAQRLVTPDYTFFSRPPEWWAEQLGQEVFLRSAAPGLVEIATAPHLATSPLPPAPSVYQASLACRPEALDLYVVWGAGEKPQRDLSVFVHLLDAQGVVLAQDDQFAPVYGQRPLTGWRAGELISDVYTLPRRPDAAAVRYGLYDRRADGVFVNELEEQLAVQCDS
jgi:hypothetical protein